MEKRVDCCVMPEYYMVSNLGRVKRKSVFIDRVKTRIAFDWTEVKDKNGYMSKENIIWTQKINSWYIVADLRYDKDLKSIRKRCLLHRLVYCSFNWLDYKHDADIWHHNGNVTDCRLENLYITNQRNNVNNRKLAFKLLELYRQWIITIPEWYNIDTEL